MKKKLFAFMLVGALALGLMGCGQSEDADSKDSANTTIDMTKKGAQKETAYITVTDLGDSEYEITVDDSVTGAEVYNCSTDDYETYTLDEDPEYVDTTTTKSFTIYDNVPDNGADVVIKVYYKGGNSSYGLMYNGVDGSVEPVEIVFNENGSSGISAGDDYLGRWGSDRITLDVSLSKAGTYVFDITWPDSAFQYYNYIYYCDYDPTSGHMECDGVAEKNLYTYEDEDSEPSLEVIYDDGSGYFYIEGGNIFWLNYTDADVDAIEFVQE